MVFLWNKFSIIWNAENVIPFVAWEDNITLIKTSDCSNTRLISNIYTLIEIIMTFSAPNLLVIVVLYQIVITVWSTFIELERSKVLFTVSIVFMELFEINLIDLGIIKIEIVAILTVKSDWISTLTIAKAILWNALTAKNGC